MKKRTEVLVLAMVLALFVVGCGNSAEPKQKVTQETEQETKQETEQEQDIKTDSYDEILEKVGYDNDKTYTADEYVEVVIKIAEEMGTTYNPELLDIVKENGVQGDGFYIDAPSAEYDFSDHEKTLENTKGLMSYFEAGSTGEENITEVYVQKIDENNIGVLLKSEF